MLAVALVNLAEDDQGDRQVIEQAQPPVEVDGGLRRLDALGLAPIGQRAVGHREIRVEPRLEREVADLLRGLEPAQAGLDAPPRIERAVEHAEVRVAATGRVQQIARLGQRDAALDLGDRLGQASRSREGDAQGVVGVRAHGGGLARPLGLRGGLLVLPGLAPAPARPTRWRAALSPARNASRPISWKR